MIANRRTRLARIGLAVLAVALAGCRTAAPTGPGEGRVSANAPISNGGAQVDTGSLDATPTAGQATGGKPAVGIVATGGSGAAGGGTGGEPTAGNEPGAVVVPVTNPDDRPPAEAALATARTSARDAALAGAGATRARIDADFGAVVATPDGKLTLTIPPGALTGDADVRVAPMDTSGEPMPNVYLPGVRFALDLGGAKIAPDQTIRIKQAVDPRFVPELQKRDPAFDPANYGLSQDASGAWVMEMPVHGPSSKSVHAPKEPATLGQTLLAEFGHLPFAPGAANAGPKFRLQTTPAEQFQATYGKPAPTNMSEWYAYENSGTFDCGSIESTCWGIELLSSLGFPVGPLSNCNPNGSPPPSPNVERVDVPTQVTFTSDDPAVHGQPGSGATVTFSMLRAVINGPDQVIADEAGKATSFTVAGAQVSAMAQVDVGPRAGAWVQATAAAGMAPIALTVEKNSPHLDLDLESDAALGALLEVQYKVDDVAGSQVLSIPDAAATTGQVRLVVHMKDDAKHDFAFTGVGGGAQTLVEAIPARLQVQRNGTYAVKLKLAGVSQK